MVVGFLPRDGVEACCDVAVCWAEGESKTWAGKMFWIDVSCAGVITLVSARYSSSYKLECQLEYGPRQGRDRQF